MRLALLLLLIGFSSISVAQSNILPGEWKGTSICQVKNSPCHDEVVVYKISPINQKDSFLVIAYKIVNNKLDSMGTLHFKYSAENKTIECLFRENWLWLFHISGNKMEGTLTRLNDKVLYRKIEVTKVK